MDRARIREVLSRLAHEQVVELVPRQGAHVARPSVKDAKDVFEARRLVEPFTVRKLAGGLGEAKIAQLRRHLAKEDAARQENDEPAIIRLSGVFHVLLAELAGNAALLRTTRELCTQTCLIISLYSASTTSSCRADEHQEIADAIIRHDGDAAVKLMLDHFDHIHASLTLSDLEDDVDLEGLFAEA